MMELYYRLRYGRDSTKYRLLVGIMAAQLLERAGWESCRVRGAGKYTLADRLTTEDVII